MELVEFTSRCDALFAELSSHADDTMQGRIDAARQRLRSERLKILVVGEFSRGKSTFINALVGLPVLPSKVNPTTATINVLKGGRPSQAVVEYVDGISETLNLPEQAINKFLDGVVTTANERAQSIRVVNIQVPGRLEAIQADVVDTPGVNDLDQAREETTFGYLRQADAAVMLLDAQQPISESERAFLKDKVFGSDVRHILFVVNKIDEVDGETNAARIVAYVRGRLEEHLGVRNAVVHAVSAKEALRARFRNEPDPERFRVFEQHLIAFAGAHATRGRLRVHLDRLDALIRDQRALLEMTSSSHAREIHDIERELAALSEADRVLEERASRLDVRLRDVAGAIATAVTAHSAKAVATFRTDMAASLRACGSDDDVESFRHTLSSALRDLAEDIEKHADTASDTARAELEREFGGLIGEGNALVKHTTSAAAAYVQNGPAVLTPPSRAVDHAKPDFSDAAIGFGLGWVGASLFGPIGIAAAVVGTYVVGRSRREQQAAELARVERERMIAALSESCDRLAERASVTGREVADRVSAQLGEEMRTRMASQRALVSASREGIRAARINTREERSAVRDQALTALASLTRIEAAARKLSEDTGDATRR